MKNVALAKLTVSNIASNPSTFQMHRWGEVIPGRRFLWRKYPATFRACLAGHVLLAAGYTIQGVNQFASPDGRVADHLEIGNKASELLGLTVDERNYQYHYHHVNGYCGLFCGSTTEEDALAAFTFLIRVSEVTQEYADVRWGKIVTALQRQFARVA